MFNNTVKDKISQIDFRLRILEANKEDKKIKFGFRLILNNGVQLDVTEDAINEITELLTKGKVKYYFSFDNGKIDCVIRLSDISTFYRLQP